MFAFGAKRTCRDRRRRINPTLMTHLCHSTITFAVMQQQRFRIAVW
jgi:hypothetical protein